MFRGFDGKIYQNLQEGSLKSGLKRPASSARINLEMINYVILLNLLIRLLFGLSGAPGEDQYGHDHQLANDHTSDFGPALP